MFVPFRDYDWPDIDAREGFATLSDDVRSFPGPYEELVNPRPIGFGRSDPHYVPVYWCTEREK